MSINYSPLKLTNENINNNYISNTIPNEDQTSTFTNFNHFSSFNNQKITNCNYNIDSNELINSFKIIQSNSFNNDDKNEIINQLRKEYDSRIINLHNNNNKGLKVNNFESGKDEDNVVFLKVILILLKNLP